MRSTPLVRLLASTAVASCLLAVVAPTGAAAATTAGATAPRPHKHLAPHRTGVAAPATTTSSTIDVVVRLHVSSATRRAVEALAHSTLSRAERRTQLRTLAPRASQVLVVRRWAGQHGFTVTSTTPWSVTLRGRAGSLAGAFGTTLGQRGIGGKGYVAPRTAPRIPSDLQGVADGVVGLDTRPHFRGRSVYGGGDVQVLNSTPVRGKDAGAGATVATVNLSGWHASDLTTYRQAAFGTTAAASMPAPTPVELTSVGGHQLATVQEDDYGLETEVALDAETIAGIAPAAKQRMYFGGNSSAGYVGILEKMASDLEDTDLTNDFQTASTSWGACELALPASDLDAMSAAITRITAAGATFFAASGDSGSYGCYDGMTAAVDFPAAAPDTVAVGGTTVTGSAPSYTSTAWDGSGGGCSQVFAAPTRQGVAGNPCTGRAVPDIATLADPSSGFWVFDRVNQWIPVGGTSLASPASAAGLAVVQAHAGLLSPLAPANNFLDKAYANPGAFADVTTGNNGLYKATAGYDLVTGLGSPTWTAVEAALTGSPAPTPTGFNEPLLANDPTYDPTTAFIDVLMPDGVTTINGFAPNGEPVDGYAADTAPTSCASTTPTAPATAALPGGEGVKQLSLSVHTTDPNVVGGCITVQRPVVVDSVTPVVPVPVASYVGTTRPAYRFSWGAASDAAPSSGILFYWIGVKDLTTNTFVTSFATTGRTFPYPGMAPLSVTPGHLYGIEVDAVDGAWNIGYRTSTFLAPFDDRSASLSSGWSRVSSKYDFMASHLQSARTGSYLQMRFTGKTLTAGVLKSRYGGYVDVYVDGVKKFRYSLYASSSLYRQQVRLATFTTRGSHLVTLKVVGAHASGSLGNYVYLDSYTVA